MQLNITGTFIIIKKTIQKLYIKTTYKDYLSCNVIYMTK